MEYSHFQGKMLSALGLGCMRLPHLEQHDDIDISAVREMVALAREDGINYFDTAWGYHGGNSERVIGEVLSQYPRESFYLADKFPGYDLSNMGKVKEIFPQQLERCGVEYFDFYLFHNVCEMNINAYLDPQYGIYDYLMEEKRRGRIRHLGFSVHGNLETTRRFLEAYGKDMEFCQIQLNWLDWQFQNAAAKVELLRQWNIPVWVMEPLRGGSLCKIPEEYQAKLKAISPNRTLAEWAFLFVRQVPGVTVTLSGMSDLSQIRENAKSFSAPNALSEEEKAVLLEVANQMTSPTTLPCTACRYCVPHCPKELDIPWIIELYNEQKYSGFGFRTQMALRAMAEEKKPTACIGCASCESVCPQTIKISEMMADFSQSIKK